jgi:hypothetical protein
MTGQPATKAAILANLRSARAEWDTLIAQVDDARVTEPGMAGYWSVKDIVAHLTAVDRWYVNALLAQARGEPVPALDEQVMELEERNRRHYEQNRQRPLGEVLPESRQVIDHLVAQMEAQPEEFITQPQAFLGLPHAVLVGQSVKDACADHYRRHMPDVRAWLQRARAG